MRFFLTSSVLKMIMKMQKWRKLLMLLLFVALCMFKFIHIMILLLLLMCLHDIWAILVWLTSKLQSELRYLQGTKDYMLTYRISDCLEVKGYTDYNYGDCPNDFKSISGYIFMLAEGVVSWKSVKQTLITNSTMEVEYIKL